MRSARRRRALVFGIASTLVMTSFFACSFPDPPLYILLEQPDGSDGGDAADDRTTSEPADAGTEEVSPDLHEAGVHDGGDPPVFERDAGEPIDAAACDDADCDCDHDGVPRASCDEDAGKTDCDDYDRRYTPNQGFLDIEPDPGKDGDWNCDGKVERYFAVNENCGGILENCNGREGFQGNPGCGQEGKYVFCKPGGLLGLGCEPDESKTQMRVQACR